MKRVVVISIALVLILIPLLAPGDVIKGPYLQDVTQTSIRVRWETDTQIINACVRVWNESYSGSFDAAETPLAAPGGFLYEAVATGLDAETPYNYWALAGESPISDEYNFVTAVNVGTPFRFAVYGDSRSDPYMHGQIAAATLATNPNIVLNTGDVVGSGNFYSQWKDEFFEPARDLFYNVPFYVAIGNHEGYAHWITDFIYYPDSPKRWWSFDFGNAHFIILDTNELTPYSSGSDQHNDLIVDLTQATDGIGDPDWIFAFFHHPAYASGSHGGEQTVQDYLVSLFETYSVDMVFNGHEHSYERSFSNNVAYVVTGGGGAGLSPIDCNPNPYKVYSEETYHFCTVDVSGTDLVLQVRYSNGAVFDSQTILLNDTDDGDGMADNWERAFFRSLNRDGNGDYDGDGLTDLEEHDQNFNPILDDMDKDGLLDGAEVSFGTDPLLADTDGDSLSDYYEVNYDGNHDDYNPYPGGVDLNATDTDTDGDGYSDSLEAYCGEDGSAIDPGETPGVIRINFQTRKANRPDGYAPDSGGDYHSNRGYGWGDTQ